MLGKVLNVCQEVECGEAQRNLGLESQIGQVILLILRKNKLLLFFFQMLKYIQKDELFNLSNSLCHQVIVSNPDEMRVYKHSAVPRTHILPSTAPVRHLLDAIVLGPVPRWSSFCT